MQRHDKANFVIKFTKDDFPELPQTNTSNNSYDKNMWSSIINKHIDGDRNTSTHDTFEGYYDGQGSPIYGKIDFANGNIYKGPIFNLFPQEIEVSDDDSEKSIYFEDESIEYERDPYENYGEMIYPNGTTFWGVFCFGKQVIDKLVKK